MDWTVFFVGSETLAQISKSKSTETDLFNQIWYKPTKFLKSAVFHAEIRQNAGRMSNRE